MKNSSVLVDTTPFLVLGANYASQSSISLYFFLTLSVVVSLQGLLNVTDEELKDAGIEDATHRETILSQLSRHRQRLDPHSGDPHIQAHKDWAIIQYSNSNLIKCLSSGNISYCVASKPYQPGSADNLKALGLMCVNWFVLIQLKHCCTKHAALKHKISLKMSPVFFNLIMNRVHMSKQVLRPSVFQFCYVAYC